MDLLPKGNAFKRIALIALFSVLGLSISLHETFSAVSASTPTSCGTSSDGGAWGFVQITIGSTVECAARMTHYYGSGANATLWGYVRYYNYWYPIATYYFSYTGESWDSGLRNYSGNFAKVVVYDGNSNKAAGTFTALISNGTPTPACPYQRPQP
jgi:hypothetical protein